MSYNQNSNRRQRGPPPQGQNFPRNQPSGNSNVQQFRNLNISPKSNLNFLIPKAKKTKTINLNFVFPKRPDEGGKCGRPFNVLTNCYDLNLKPQVFLMYDIKFTYKKIGRSKISAGSTNFPQSSLEFNELKNREDKKRIFAAMQSKFSELKIDLNFDGQAVLYSLVKIAGVEPSKSYQLEHEINGQPHLVNVVIKTTPGGEDLQELIDHVAMKNHFENFNSQESVRFLNVYIKNMLIESNFYRIHGRFNVLNLQPMPLLERLYDYHEGFNLSVRAQRWSVRIVVDKTQASFYREQPLVNTLRDLGLDPRRFDPARVAQFSRRLANVRIETSHCLNSAGSPYKSKHTIRALADQPAGRIMIRDVNQSVYDYLTTKYPSVVGKFTKNSYCIEYGNASFVPVELCHVLPFQDTPSHDPQVTKEMIKKAAVKPFMRRTQIEEFVRNLVGITEDHKQRYVNERFINVNSQCLRATVRQLVNTTLYFDNNQPHVVNGQWRINTFSQPFIKTSGEPLNWAVIYFDRNLSDRPIPVFCQAGQRLGMRITNNYKDILAEEGNLQEIFSFLIKEKYDFSLIVINNEDYGRIKVLAELEIGLVTQCCRVATWNRMNPQIAGNLWLKLNGKLGGVNWDLIPASLIQKVMQEPLIVMGFDVTHPGPNFGRGSDIDQSIVGAVATKDGGLMKYMYQIRPQPGYEVSDTKRRPVEDIREMRELAREFLLRYSKINQGRLPLSILVYRDGVSEGQYQYIVNSEVRQIQEACISIRSDYQPGITFVVVGKRHNLRFFADSNGNIDNVPPGTVIDTEVCSPHQFDFYLSSHIAIQGTAKAAHYHVIWDDNNWGSDDLQNFSYLMCHGYARCTRSVSYPAPTYYAHLAAFRGRAFNGVRDMSLHPLLLDRMMFV